MKVIKHGIFEGTSKCECKKCKCQFEFDKDDIKANGTNFFFYENEEYYYVLCPECKSKVRL